VLILPPGHAEEVARPRYRLNARERWIIGAVLAVVVAIAVAVIVSIGTGERTTAAGCIDVKFPTTIGGAELYNCGAQAREMCASVGLGTEFTDIEGKAIAVECRKAGLPVGS
jgi:hypothetical protein